jgi:choline dehydrogenase
VVGGSSVTNGAIALRGHPEHYDEWDAYVDGYGWETWLPWFRAIERDLDFGSAPWHGDAGPIPISRYAPEGFLPVQEAFATACAEAGHAAHADHNAPRGVGVGPVPLNMLGGRRQTPADHYLDPALGRSNLRLESGVSVDRLRLRAGRVVAVEGGDAEGRAASWPCETAIVALGTYASPALLLRSGIGPEDELHRHGIRPEVVLPGVGRGMQDHPKVSYRFDLLVPPPAWPHPWYQVLLTGAHEVGVERRVYQVMPYAGVVEGGQPYVDLNTQIADARSRRGSVRLASRDPSAQPVIDMGWLVEDADRAAAAAAGERVMELAATRALREVLTPWRGIDEPDHALRTVETFHHPVGTCRMGRPADPDAVVDAAGGLRGVEGAHVMDASVIPRVPSANTHLCVIALAERLAARHRAGGREPAPTRAG